MTGYGRRLAVRLRDDRCVASECHHRDLLRRCSSMGPVTSYEKPVLREPVPCSSPSRCCYRKIVPNRCRLVRISSVRFASSSSLCFFLPLDRFFRDPLCAIKLTPSVIFFLFLSRQCSFLELDYYRISNLALSSSYLAAIPLVSLAHFYARISPRWVIRLTSDVRPSIREFS